MGEEKDALQPKETEQVSAEKQAETEHPDAVPVAESETENTETAEFVSDETRDTQPEIETVETDADEDARYHAEKEKEIQKLAREIEDKNSINTKSKRRNWWIKTILLLVLIGASVALMFTLTSYLAPEGAKSLSEMIEGASLTFFFVFIGVILLYMFVESMKYAYLLKTSTGKFRLRNSVKTMFLGKYYDGITPLGTGGQPFQIYYLHKKDIPAGVATAVPLVRYIVSTVVFCLIATALIIYAGVTHLIGDWTIADWGWGEPVILAIAAVSLFVNLLIPVIMLLGSLAPRLGKKLIIKIVGLLSKMHIVKHRYPVMKKYVYEVGEYKRSLKLFFKKGWKLIPFAFLCILETLLSIAVPFFAILAIAGPDVIFSNPDISPFGMFINIMALAVISFYVTSLIPTPGNSGASEAMTTIVFLFVPGIKSVVGWIILIWRFFTYYIYILSGIGISVFEIIRGAVRQKRAQKNNLNN